MSALSLVPSLSPSLPFCLSPSSLAAPPQCLPFVLVRLIYETGLHDENTYVGGSKWNLGGEAKVMQKDALSVAQQPVTPKEQFTTTNTVDL